MSKFLTLALSSLALASTAFAVDFLPGQITKIDADYRCELSGGGVAFRVAAPGVPARVWQTDVGQEMGLELEVTSFLKARCPGCYSFDARLTNKGRPVMLARGQSEMVPTGQILLNYSVIDPTSKKINGSFNLPCKVVTKR